MKARTILWGDGVHDDTPAMQALIEGLPIYDRFGERLVLEQVWPRPHVNDEESP